jgi:hypothetical protein
MVGFGGGGADHGDHAPGVSRGTMVSMVGMVVGVGWTPKSLEFFAHLEARAGPLTMLRESPGHHGHYGKHGRLELPRGRRNSARIRADSSKIRADTSRF